MTPAHRRAADAGYAHRDRKRYAWLLSVRSVLRRLGRVARARDWRCARRVVAGRVPLPRRAVHRLGAGRGPQQPARSAVPALEADRYYRWITYAGACPRCGSPSSHRSGSSSRRTCRCIAQIATVLSAGLAGALHQPRPRTRAQEHRARALAGQDHPRAHRLRPLFIEHNRGHHRDVATPVDPASSRMGETIYTSSGARCPARCAARGRSSATA